MPFDGNPAIWQAPAKTIPAPDPVLRDLMKARGLVLLKWGIGSLYHHCALDAIWRATGGSYPYLPTDEAIQVFHFNDTRTHAEVVAAFDAAISAHKSSALFWLYGKERRRRACVRELAAAMR